MATIRLQTAPPIVVNVRKSIWYKTHVTVNGYDLGSRDAKRLANLLDRIAENQPVPEDTYIGGHMVAAAPVGRNVHVQIGCQHAIAWRPEFAKVAKAIRRAVA